MTTTSRSEAWTYLHGLADDSVGTESRAEQKRTVARRSTLRCSPHAIAGRCDRQAPKERTL